MLKLYCGVGFCLINMKDLKKINNIFLKNLDLMLLEKLPKEKNKVN